MAKPYVSGRHLDPAVRLGIDANGSIKRAWVRGVDVSNDVSGYQVTRDGSGRETITLTLYGFAFEQIPDDSHAPETASEQMTGRGGLAELADLIDEKTNGGPK